MQLAIHKSPFNKRKSKTPEKGDYSSKKEKVDKRGMKKSKHSDSNKSEK